MLGARTIDTGCRDDECKDDGCKAYVVDYKSRGLGLGVR
jgi:ATP-dependent exoDNAse (exonuclease V) beta subunit